MHFSKRKIAGVAAMLLVLVFAVGLSACGEGHESEEKQKETQSGVANERESFPPAYKPTHHVEYNNFNKAQKLYDTPSTIIWCTTTWNNPSAPMVTVPVAGKLTSSSVSYLPQDKREGEHGEVVRENFSDDGMYHGHPPAYRYGFTPGGQYVDFSEMQTFCTTALTEFQRQNTEVTIAVNQSAQEVSEKAEEVLAEGIEPETGKISPEAQTKAQKILQEANLSGSK